MANYLTMSLDPNAGSLYHLMSSQVNTYQQKIKDLEKELDDILRLKNLTIVELFHKIAIR